MTSGDVRASDQEREHVARLLRDHCVAGRLSFDELDHRLHRVYLARTRLELEQLILDLPSGSDGSRAEDRRRRIFWPGVAVFHEERHLDGRVRVWPGASGDQEGVRNAPRLTEVRVSTSRPIGG